MPVQWTPARESRFRVDVTEVGRSTQWLPSASTGHNLRDLPSLAAVAQPEVAMPLAVVLATGMPGDETGRPAISYRPVGIGRVVVVEGAGMWRWAFLPPKHQELDAVYGTLWRSLVRWLVSQVSLLPSQQMALRPDKVTFGENEAVAATLMLRETTADSTPVVELTGGALEQARQIRTVPIADALGQYLVPIGTLPAGQYKLNTKDGTAPATKAVAMFEVRGNLAERLDAAARRDIMNMLARESGGKVLEDDDVAQIGTWFGEHLAVMRPDRTVRHHAWDRWWVLAGAMGLWAAAWSVRRASGLI